MFKRLLARWPVSQARPEEVFTPFGPATLTYVERPGPEGTLRRALAIPGMQVLVSGAPGSGKTTLVQHVLAQRNEPFIVTRCFAGTTLEQVTEDGFEQFSLLYSQTHFHKQLHRPVSLTLQWLGRCLGFAGATWVVEDIHHLPPADRLLLLQSLKHCSDIANTYPRIKIILVHSVAGDNKGYAPGVEACSRLTEVSVPLLTHAELEAVIDKGQRQLNIVFNHDARRDILGAYPFSARLCHQRCLALCHQQWSRPQKTKQGVKENIVVV